MLAKSSSPPPIPALAESWRSALRRLTPTTLLEIGLALWLLLLVALPVLVFGLLPEHAMEEMRIEEHGHLLIECFCGFVALTIASMILAVSIKRRNPGYVLFGLGFLAMGVFDILHAWTDPFSEAQRFVLYHTLSTLLGAAFILAGVVARIVTDRGHGLSRADLATTATGFLLVVGIAFLYRLYIPNLIPADATYFSFSPDTHTAHYLAGLFYALAAVAFYRYFRKHGQVLALVVASLLVLFAQSAYLFSFSGLWNMTWWMWHGVKVVFYLGIMVTVFVSYLLALETIEKSRHVLARANHKLKRSQQAIQRFNQELKIRNRMVQEAMSSLSLDNALDVVSRSIHQIMGFSGCELILRIRPDEVDEFERRVHRLSSRWPIRAQRADAYCSGKNCQALNASGGQLFECGYRDDSGRDSICLSLAANGQEIGHLRLYVTDTQALHHGSRSLGQMRALAVEVGSIVHNALLYHDLQDATEFRLALLRVSNLLTSTLELDRVLESVCRESAALLDSDGALVWLPGKDPGHFTLAARSLGGGDEPEIAELDAWCRDGRFCASLLQSIDGAYRPLDIFWHDDSRPAGLVRPDGCPWEALAIFPLLDQTSLIGVMVLVRKAGVRFSAATLAKGELLAGQVRIAINNARSYERLAEINQQLKLAEEHKIRSDRMAVLGQMAASVAHEVRNPLSAITNCLAVLRVGSGEDTRSRAALGIIQDEVERLTNLTTNFLTFGKPRASIRKPVVLEGLLQKVCLALERHIAQEELPIRVELDLPPTATLLLFDADGLETVLWNLLLNASQAIHGAGSIYVTARPRPDHFLLVVSDTGKGIAAAERARIFEPFYSQRSLGAGLGLAIVQRLVQEWGGRIRLRSRPGQGASFCLRVPMASYADDAAEREVA